MRRSSVFLNSRRGAALAFGLLVLATMVAAPAAAGPAHLSADVTVEPDGASWGGLLDELEDNFRILRLRQGVVLEPREDIDGIRTIEVTHGRFAIDGSDVSASELGHRLGALAAPVIRLAEVRDRDLDALFRRTGAGAMEISSPEPPEPPEPPEAPEADEVSRPSRVTRSVRTKSRYRAGDDTQLVVGNDLTVERGEIARDAVVVGGTLRVEGEVVGDAVAIGGNAEIHGRVSGDVAVIGGQARLGSDAEVMGSVISLGSEVEIDDRAQIHGEVVDVPFGPNFRFSGWPGVFAHSDWTEGWGRGWFSPWSHFFGMMWRFFGLALLALLVCLAWLLGRRPIERIGERVVAEPWKSGLVGLAAQILFLPLLLLVVLILCVSVIGIPFLLLVPFALVALVVVAFLGYAAVAHRIGLWACTRFEWKIESPYVVLLVGLAIIQLWTFVGAALDLGGGPIRFFAAMFLVFGFCVKYFAWTVGFGAGLLTRFGTASTWERPVPGAPPAPLPPRGVAPMPPSGFDAPGKPSAPLAPEDSRPFWEREELGEEPEAAAGGVPDGDAEGSAEDQPEDSSDDGAGKD
jgi:hypothetical protein